MVLNIPTLPLFIVPNPEKGLYIYTELPPLLRLRVAATAKRGREAGGKYGS
jgi:hypothetical protein